MTAAGPDVRERLFRAEALRHHEGAHANEGDVLRFERAWARLTYAVLVWASIAGFIFLSLFNVNEYASGPAVVRIDGRRMVTATIQGTVESVEIAPAQLVHQGDVLVRMHDTEEADELARANRELDLLMVRMLRDPSEASVRQQIANLRATRDQAENLVHARTIRAETSGYVSDVRVRSGQHVNPGDVLLALTPNGEARASLVAMISADYRPMLRSGLTMRFELDGFRYEYANLELVDVSAEAVGSMEMQRFLGEEKADAVGLPPGSKVLVTARLPAATFSSEGQPYGYFDGLTGSAEIRVRREPLLMTLIPALKAWLPGLGANARQDGSGRFARGLWPPGRWFDTSTLKNRLVGLGRRLSQWGHHGER